MTSHVNTTFWETENFKAAKTSPDTATHSTATGMIMSETIYVKVSCQRGVYYALGRGFVTLPFTLRQQHATLLTGNAASTQYCDRSRGSIVTVKLLRLQQHATHVYVSEGLHLYTHIKTSRAAQQCSSGLGIQSSLDQNSTLFM